MGCGRIEKVEGEGMMSEREREIEVAMNMIVGTLDMYKLTLTADLDKKILVVIDTTNNKRYGIQQVKEER